MSPAVDVDVDLSVDVVRILGNVESIERGHGRLDLRSDETWQNIPRRAFEDVWPFLHLRVSRPIVDVPNLPCCRPTTWGIHLDL